MPPHQLSHENEENLAPLFLPLWFLFLLTCLCILTCTATSLYRRRRRSHVDFSSPSRNETTRLLRSATWLSLPAQVHASMAVHDFMALKSQPGRCTPVFAFPHTRYIGVPGKFYTERRRWDTAVGHARRQGRAVRVRCWRWDGVKFTVPVVVIDEGGSRERVWIEDGRARVCGRQVEGGWLVVG